MHRSDLSEEPGVLETDRVEVRNLGAADLDWIVRIDAAHSGKPRREYYRLKLAESIHDTGVRISLAALVGGEPAGFLMGRLYYGEFGTPEPVAILDSIGVAQPFAGHAVGRALMRQLEMNLAALGVERIETQVAWEQTRLIDFFRRAGFRPSPRLCLEKTVNRPRD